MRMYWRGQDRELDIIDRALADHQRRDRRDGRRTGMDDLVAIQIWLAHKVKAVTYVEFRRLAHGPELDLKALVGRCRT